ncbi:MAG TPA: avidin/streptavidin family protein [Acidimicrobiales bacterium]|nr:avidin/streptavidin family protein [Acidimicrobiales bacterium]
MSNALSDVPASAASGEHPRRLGGIWHNQHGSELHLHVGAGGALAGTFQSATGDPSGDAQPVAGRADMAPWGTTTAVGFLVLWPEAHSVTCWSGRYDTALDRIEATWVMTAEAEEHDAWMATRIGHDVFVRGD